ncbi:MAG: integral membrane protein [Myxococcota bacterium]|jgi:integral membrane protein
MTRQWFTAVAIAEGLSMVTLFGIAMPLKYGMGMEHATSVVGWVHGVLVFVYMIALWSTARVDGWSWGKSFLGFVASLIPFAPFIFAKKLHG